ncbi:MAG: hypothetical protein HFF18_12000 [Oscillospiraceae bacterium]|nr:hypothetical protein [Oscillospiraceae bacterium]
MKKKWTRLMALFLSVCMVLSLSSGALALGVEELSETEKTDTLLVPDQGAEDTLQEEQDEITQALTPEPSSDSTADFQLNTEEETGMPEENDSDVPEEDELSWLPVSFQTTEEEPSETAIYLACGEDGWTTAEAPCGLWFYWTEGDDLLYCAIDGETYEPVEAFAYELSEGVCTILNEDEAEERYYAAGAEENGAYYIWYEIVTEEDEVTEDEEATGNNEAAPIQDGSVYTPEDAESDGLTVHYLSWTPQNNGGWYTSTIVDSVHLYEEGGTNLANSIDAGSKYAIAYTAGNTRKYMYAPFQQTSATAQADYTENFSLFTFELVDSGFANAYVIHSVKDTSLYLTGEACTYTAGGNTYHQLRLANQGTTFYTNAVDADSENGSYYIWYTTEPEVPPTEPWNPANTYKAQLGNNSNFSGEVVSLENALYTFASSGNGYQISATVPGEDATVYLNIGGNFGNTKAPSIPNKSTAAVVSIDNGAGVGFFYLRDTSSLHFPGANGAIHWNRCTNPCGAAHNIALFYPLGEGDTSSEEIPGYVRLTAIDDIQDEGKYLLAATAGNEWYVLYPSSNTNTTEPYSHIAKVVPPDAESFNVLGGDIAQMFDDSTDNTWVFTGGADVEGGFEQTRGQRNFVGQFEEYIRWTNTANANNGADPTRQRYTINVATASQDLAEVVGSWDSLVTPCNPRAVAYMMQSGDSEADLNVFIDKALALRNDTGFAVIQTLNGEGNETVDSVVDTYSSDPGYTRIVVVKHTLDSPMLTGSGHYELGRQLAEATFGSSANYPCAQGVDNFEEAEQPDVYSSSAPEVSFAGGNMTIRNTGGFVYELRLDAGITVSGSAVDEAAVSGLPEGEAYTLVVRSADGRTQYRTTYGTAGGNTANGPALTSRQEEIAGLVSSEEPLTWLFMGDSITHGALWTKGYDSVPQTFDKYLDFLGRNQDVVINTAVSGATAGSTLRTIEHRLEQYTPDVVAIMLGTNDAANSYSDGGSYEANLEAIISAVRAKNPDAVIVLRSPTGHWTGSNVVPYCETMKRVAEAHGLIYVDQYTETQEALDTYSSWIKGSQLFYGNNLHPGALGQLAMAKMFIKAIGLWDEDTPIANLDYVATTPETSTVVPEVTWTTAEDGTATLALASMAGYGQTTLSATKDGQTWSVTAKAGKTAELPVPGGVYTVNVTAVSTSAAKTVTFAAQTVDTAEKSPEQPTGPIEFTRSLEAAIADPATKVRYLSFGGSWTASDSAYEVKLYQGSDGTLDTDGVDVGNYVIFAPVVTDGRMPRFMHYSTDKTNQCQHTANTVPETVSTSDLDHLFTFAPDGKGGCTIRTVRTAASTVYLSTTASGSQLAFVSEPVSFNVTLANNDGSYYIWWEEEAEEVLVPGAPPQLPLLYNEAYQRSSGPLEEGVYAIVATTTDTDTNRRARIMHPLMNGSTPKLDQWQIEEGETIDGAAIRITKEEHSLLVEQSGGGYTFQVLGGSAKGKYLSGGAGTLTLSDTPTSFTAEAVEGGGYYLRWSSGSTSYCVGWNDSWCAQTENYRVNLYKGIPAEPDLAETGFSGTSTEGPLVRGDTNSYFRIPSLITLNNGWIVASSDIRWRGTGDNPSNIDTIVSISKDDGATWDWEVVNYFADHATTSSNPSSTAFIDPSFVQSEKDGTVWMIVDATPAYGGLMSGNRMLPSSHPANSGFDERGRVLVGYIPDVTTDTYHPERGQYSYDYRVDLHAASDVTAENTKGDVVTLYPICYEINETPTNYYADAFANVYYDYGGSRGIEPVLVQQMGSNKLIHSNLFYLQSEWKVPCTFYLMVRSAKIGADGLVWNDPCFIDVKNPGERFTGVCPGRGTVIEAGDHERIIFPLYDNATGNELASVTYSDDGGQTWQRGARAAQLNGTGKSSESQIVVLPNGDLRMFSRNTINYIGYTDSSDNGQTWGKYQKDNELYSQNPGNGCMVSFINVEGYLVAPDNTVYENLIMASYPRVQRHEGIIRIGAIQDKEGYPIQWLDNGDYLLSENNAFIYSCLTQLRNPDGTYRNEVSDLPEMNLNSNVPIPYHPIDFERLLPGWTFTMVKPSGELPTLELDQSLLDLDVGKTGTVEAIITNAEGGIVTWSSSNEAVAAVQNGVVTAAASGRAAVTATLTVNGIVRTAALEVVVQDGETIVLPSIYADGMTQTEESLYPKLTGELADGFYVIRDPNPGDGKNARAMHSAKGDTKTNQCGCAASNDMVALGSCGNAHLWRFTRQEDGTYTIESAANPGKFLTNTASGGQLALSETATRFTITGGNGSYQITVGSTSLSCKPGWEMTAGGKSLELYQQHTTYTCTASTAGLERLMDVAREAGIEIPASCDAALELQKVYSSTDKTEAETLANAAQAQIDAAAKELYALLRAPKEPVEPNPPEPPVVERYTITYVVDGVTAATQTYEAGAVIRPAAASGRPGYTFRWSGLPTTMPETDIIVTGVYTAILYTVTFTYNGSSTEVICTYGEIPAAPAVPSYTSGNYRYYFSGWDHEIAAVTEDTVYNALYSRTYTGADYDYDDDYDYVPSRPGGSGTTNVPDNPVPGVETPEEVEIIDGDVPLADMVLPFADVKSTDWYRDAVAYVHSKGMMNGTTETDFAPQTSLSRGMIVTILHRLENTPVAEAVAFVDVPADKYYAEAVAWAHQNGVVTGVSATHFLPEQDASREQLAVILYRYAQLKGYDTTARANLSGFTDAPSVSGYAVEAMQWAVAVGLIKGKTETTLVPSGSATRAEVAAILMRFCENVVK